eukprot:CAMPEP_0176187630 /NCGR_PEP_ID=MMETSP0121_2-20121125/2493_1 /TAXON_ID=160619 /ORGANISM="Kryptoperidinium foliaceum, Strain CCMP 1326" /LENGTH=298 /DNA_ID=CAMNT_0017526169 /DNA_START=50 /DNA_END=946 /DNA_ORIENTATION=-
MILDADCPERRQFQQNVTKPRHRFRCCPGDLERSSKRSLGGTPVGPHEVTISTTGNVTPPSSPMRVVEKVQARETSFAMSVSPKMESKTSLPLHKSCAWSTRPRRWATTAAHGGPDISELQANAAPSKRPADMGMRGTPSCGAACGPDGATGTRIWKPATLARLRAGNSCPKRRSPMVGTMLTSPGPPHFGAPAQRSNDWATAQWIGSAAQRAAWLPRAADVAKSSPVGTRRSAAASATKGSRHASGVARKRATNAEAATDAARAALSASLECGRSLATAPAATRRAAAMPRFAPLLA